MADEKALDPDALAGDAHVGNENPLTKKLAARQLAFLSAIDVIIARLDRLLSTASGQERALATVDYVASTLHHLCASAPWASFQARLAVLTRLKGRATQLSTLPSLKSRFKALATLVSETRYTLRLFELIPLWVWGSETLKHPPSDPIIHALTILQIISNVVYQFLENVTYLASKGVISKRYINKYGGHDKLEIWSNRGWFGHVFLQFFVLWREHVLRKQRLAKRAAAGDIDIKSIETEETALRVEIRSWRKRLLNNIIWTPLCFHWCFEEGVGIPSSFSGPISFMAGAWTLSDMWAATANA
ncbi:peroxin-11C Pex11C-Penicillium chrysogenum [Penicillium taxi]|uniref:peroxin-11C Pex11C-Penicillium chrysogenum n=1 Tax=Penicillium taxi TaxID=168475 RepID=UPI0025450C62|nr:peroxin-11C Pex11C-Penicillium chrysogenum [Penicillium taxi]KAJ5894715.1 peroxin-11C Pex11C-Penicillium chrysogenum [Penicillium taxi]